MSEYWIETHSGLRLDLAEPDPASILIEDIAHALSLEVRFSGHTLRPLSVAEHSLYVEALVAEHQVAPAVRLGALLHDAHEAYVKDLPRPLKRLLGHAYLEVAARVDSIIFAKFRARYAPIIKIADDRALASEAAALLPSKGEGWGLASTPAPWVVEAVKTHKTTPAYAHEVRFLRMFRALAGAMEEAGT